jgi:ATP phosphoribosyltransferase
MMLTNSTPSVRLSLPSKGRLAEDSLAFLEACGLEVYKPNPRQYEAVIPALPEVRVLFQRAADIVASVRDGSVDFGITGMDVVAERRNAEQRAANGEVLVLHDALAFGACRLALAVPESWEEVVSVTDLPERARLLGRPLRIATQYPHLTADFLDHFQVPYKLIAAEGTLETAPAIGYADMICDIVSSGQTLRDNRLRPLVDGEIMASQAVLIGNTYLLRQRPATLHMARILIEYFEAHLRASDNLAVFANMRGASLEEVGERIFTHCKIHGLQGPTISRVVVRGEEQNWYAANLVVPRRRLFQTIQELRAAGGSGVVVLPVTYIFDEEPPRYRAMLEALGMQNEPEIKED